MKSTLWDRLQKHLMSIEYNQGIDRLITSLVYEIDNKTFIDQSELRNYLIDRQYSTLETIKAQKLNAKQLRKINQLNNQIKEVQSNEIFNGNIWEWESFVKKNRNREENIKGLLLKSEKLYERYLKRKQKYFEMRSQQPTNKKEEDNE